MSYTKKTWVCDEYISASDLNHIEDGIEANALPAVTSADSGKVLSVNENGEWVVSEGGGSCDCGFDCTEAVTEVFNGTATPGTYNAYEITASGGILSERIQVVINGVSYVVEAELYEKTFYVYGADFDPTTWQCDFSEYPFAVVYFPGGGSIRIISETSSSYSCALYSIALEASTTPCFKKAVQSVPSAFLVEWVYDDGSRMLLTPYSEIEAAFEDGLTIQGVCHQGFGDNIYDCFYDLASYSSNDGVFRFVRLDTYTDSNSVSVETTDIDSNNGISHRAVTLSS